MLYLGSIENNLPRPILHPLRAINHQVVVYPKHHLLPYAGTHHVAHLYRANIAFYQYRFLRVMNTVVISKSLWYVKPHRHRILLIFCLTLCSNWRDPELDFEGSNQPPATPWNLETRKKGSVHQGTAEPQTQSTPYLNHPVLYALPVGINRFLERHLHFMQ